MDLSAHQDLSRMSLRVSYTNENGELRVTNLNSNKFVYDSSVGYYTVKFIDLNVADLRAVLNVEILCDGVVVSDMVCYSVETYVYNRLNKSNDEIFKTLLRELMKYSDSAKKYFY